MCPRCPLHKWKDIILSGQRDWRYLFEYQDSWFEYQVILHLSNHRANFFFNLDFCFLLKYSVGQKVNLGFPYISQKTPNELYGQTNIINLQYIEQEGFPGCSVVKNLPAKQERWVQSVGQEDSSGGGMATHSSIPCLENSMD